MTTLDHDLLNQAEDRAIQLLPLLGDRAQEIARAIAESDERDDKGRLTQRAKQRRQQLRNPAFNTTHVATARRAINEKLIETSRVANEAIAEAVVAQLVASQAQLEKSILDEEINDIASSRQAEAPAGDGGPLSDFAAAMRERGVAERYLTRQVGSVLDVIAQIVWDASHDPQFDNPDNIILRMIRGGIFEAGFTRLIAKGKIQFSDDEILLLGDAYDARSYDDAVARHLKLEEQLGRRIPVAPRFGAAVEYLIRKKDELTEGEQNVLYWASAQRWKRQAEHICTFLGLPLDEVARVEATISAVMACDGRYRSPQDADVELLAKEFSYLIVRLENDRVPHDEWIPHFQAALMQKGSSVERLVPTKESFFKLLSAALRHSRSYQKFDEEREHEHQEAHRAQWEAKGTPHFMTIGGQLFVGHPEDYPDLDDGVSWTYEPQSYGKDENDPVEIGDADAAYCSSAEEPVEVRVELLTPSPNRLQLISVDHPSSGVSRSSARKPNNLHEGFE